VKKRGEKKGGRIEGIGSNYVCQQTREEAAKGETELSLKKE